MIEYLIDNLPYVIGFASVIIGYAIGRIFGVSIEVTKIIPVVASIIQAIWKVEIQTSNETPPPSVNYNTYREQLACTDIDKALTKKQKSTVRKIWGTIGAGLKYIFPIIKPGLDTIIKKNIKKLKL